MVKNNDNSQSPIKLGAFGRDVSESVADIIDHAYENAVQVVQAEITIPKGYMRIPDETVAFRKKTNTMQDNLCIALSAAIPAALTAAGVALNAPAVTVVLLAGGGGIAGTFIQKSSKAMPVDLDPLREEDISVRIVVDPEKLEGAKLESFKALENLERRVSSFESKAADVHDITLDRRFGEWIQQFMLYADRRPDDQDVQSLLGMLMPRLAAMGIEVYDDVRLNDDGMPDVPIQDYLFDNRKGEEYTEVVRPAIYSDKGILAKGEIR